MTLMAVWAIARWRIAKIFFDGLGPEFSHNPAMMVRDAVRTAPRSCANSRFNGNYTGILSLPGEWRSMQGAEIRERSEEFPLDAYGNI